MNLFTRRRFIHTAAITSLALTPKASAQAPTGRPAKIRIGQIGTGHAHAAGKVDTIRASDAYELVGVVEPDAERRAKAENTKSYAGVTWMTEEAVL